MGYTPVSISRPSMNTGKPRSLSSCHNVIPRNIIGNCCIPIIHPTLRRALSRWMPEKWEEGWRARSDNPYELIGDSLTGFCPSPTDWQSERLGLPVRSLRTKRND